MFPCTSLVYSLVALCSFLIYILLFTDQKKKRVGGKNSLCFFIDEYIYTKDNLTFLIHYNSIRQAS